VIPTRADQPRQPGFDKAAYRQRNRVERSVNRLKQFRPGRHPLRQVGRQLSGLVTLAVTLIWL
jgi:transposase